MVFGKKPLFQRRLDEMEEEHKERVARMNSVQKKQAQKQQPEQVDHPAHYNAGQIEVIDFIADQGWLEGFCKGNAVKYISRASHKGKELQDLKKAQWYLKFYCDYLEAKEAEQKK